MLWPLKKRKKSPAPVAWPFLFLHSIFNIKLYYVQRYSLGLFLLIFIFFLLALLQISCLQRCRKRRRRQYVSNRGCSNRSSNRKNITIYLIMIEKFNIFRKCVAAGCLGSCVNLYVLLGKNWPKEKNSSARKLTAARK